MIVTLPPLVIATDAKLLALSSKMEFAEPAAKVAAPATVSVPASVIGPTVETLSEPSIALAPRAIEF